MGQKLDFELLNFDRELGNLDQAVTDLQKAPPGCGPELSAYTQALKTLNAEMLERLEPLLRRLQDSGEARPSLRGPQERGKCQGMAAHSQVARDAIHAKSGPIANGRGQRIGTGGTRP